MGEAKVIVLAAVRAKALRPQCDSGVFRAVHAGAQCVASDTAPDRDPAPGQDGGERLRSAVRKNARAACASAFKRAAERLDLSAADIAATIDESRQRVADMMTGARPIAADHFLLIGLRMPELLAAYGEELFGR